MEFKKFKIWKTPKYYNQPIEKILLIDPLFIFKVLDWCRLTPERRARFRDFIIYVEKLLEKVKIIEKEKIKINCCECGKLADPSFISIAGDTEKGFWIGEKVVCGDCREKLLGSGLRFAPFRIETVYKELDEISQIEFMYLWREKVGLKGRLTCQKIEKFFKEGDEKEKNIKENIKNRWQCRGCHRWYNRIHEECPICGISKPD